MILHRTDTLQHCQCFFEGLRSADTLTASAIIRSGRLVCNDETVQVVSFTFCAGGNCLADGKYREAVTNASQLSTEQ
jgi:hypothetical protein